MVNSQELKDQIQELQQQNQAERELHATELQQLRDEKTQLQQQHARELHQQASGQPPPGAAEAKAWMDKAQEPHQELEHVKYHKSVLERQKALLQSNVNAGKGGAPVSWLNVFLIVFELFSCASWGCYYYPSACSQLVGRAASRSSTWTSSSTC